jgi:SanA protein
MKFLKIFFLILLLPIVLILCNYWWISHVGNKMIVHENTIQLKNRYVLVLGAGKEYRMGKRPNYFFNGRVDAVVKLRQSYPNCKIIISGISDGNHYDEANDLKKELLTKGVKDTLIMLDSDSKDTYASLQMFNKKYLYEPVIIVSQKAHLCRALWMAKQMNINAVGYVAEGWPKREPKWFLMREMGARVKATLEILF